MTPTTKLKLKPGFAARLKAILNGEIPEAPLPEPSEISDEILVSKANAPLDISIPIAAVASSQKKTQDNTPSSA